jgi:16S rRNA G966 N2-methylase RsmD
VADIAFIDPPYHLEGEYLSALEALSAARCGFVVAQHATRFALEERYGRLTKTRVLRQGDNCLSFFEAVE